MSTISFLSSDSSIHSEHSTYFNIHSILGTTPFHESNEDILSSSSIRLQNSNLFDHDQKLSNNNSQEFLNRLCYQRSRLLRIYNIETERRVLSTHLITFLNKIDQLINEYENHESTSSTNYEITTVPKHLDAIYSTYFPDIPSINCSNDIHVNELLNEHNSKETEKNVNNITYEQNSHSDYTDHTYERTRETKKLSKKKLTIRQLKSYKYEGCCPLTTRTYGLDPMKHGVRHLPCTRVTTPINLYKHLIQYHQLTHPPSIQIVRLLADEYEERDIDLFSLESTSLIATNPTVYRAQCPLNQYGKYGIIFEHKIRLCTQPNQPLGSPLVRPKDVCLYDHFVIYHQMKRSCAQRLAEAITKNQTEPIFRPDEQLLNDTYYIQCPLRHPRAICWKTPISSRHMGQHLTGVHKLDRTARHQILTTLRKRSS